jgi:hypothetical protein
MLKDWLRDRERGTQIGLSWHSEMDDCFHVELILSGTGKRCRNCNRQRSIRLEGSARK